MTIERFIAGLPKAELHLHIEGTLEPEMALALGRRNGVVLPWANTSELRAAYDFANLQEFLDLYYQGIRVLIEERDFHELTMAYLRQVGAQNVRHAEVFFDAQAHTARGVPFATVIDGIWRGLMEGEQEFGVSSRLILCFLRDRPVAEAEEIFDQALEYRDRLVAVCLDSAEVGNPPGKFADLFARARRRGLLAVAHAGEEGPAEYVRQAVERLGASRIDHGNHTLDDAALVRKLARAGMPFTVCPLSNLRLGVVARMADHPLQRMLDAGLLVTVNSDDPAYFGGYVNENYLAAAVALGLDEGALRGLARNSFAASFLSEAAKRDYIAKVDSYGT